MYKSSYKRKLVARCIDCGRPRHGRFRRCERCQSERLSKAMTASWDRRKKTEPPPQVEQGPFVRVSYSDLERLMAEVDAKAKKALEAAAKLKDKGT